MRSLDALEVNNIVQNYAYPNWMMDNNKLNAYYAKLNLAAGDDLWTVFAKLQTFTQSQLIAQLTAPVDRTDFQALPPSSSHPILT